MEGIKNSDVSFEYVSDAEDSIAKKIEDFEDFEDPEIV